MARRMRAVLLAALAGLMLGACQAKPEAQTAPVTLEALQYELENQAIDFQNMWYYQLIEEQTGVRVIFDEVKDPDWVTRQSLMFASGNLHDLILRGYLDVEDYGVTQHLLLPLDAYLDEYMPNYVEKLRADDSGEVIPASDGQTYYVGFLIAQGINTDGHFFINKTWLERLNLEVPTTIDELTAVLRAFRDGDPNGNGVRDEIPYQATLDDCNTGLYNAFSAWGVPMNIDFVSLGEGGRVRFTPAEEGFRQCAAWLHQLYREGLMDVECITQDSNLWATKINQGTAGYFSYWRLGNTALRPDVAAEFQCMVPVAQTGYQAQLGRLEDTVEVGAALTVQNRNVPASLRWLDAQFDTENMLVAQNGPLGENLILREDGRYQVLTVPSAQELYDVVPVICGQFYAPPGYYESVYIPAPHREEKAAYGQLYESAGVLEPQPYGLLVDVIPKTSEESGRLHQLITPLRNTVNSALVTFITQGVTEEGWAEYLDNLTKCGMAEYTAIYQAAYDRYMEGRVEP